ncbi:MAG: hydroxymethylbilane synthase, partial [Deltaproteobacteria bacterium]|nr:hydroxymethylbilane synthase [Deltaproteobacteria bacterium]
IGQGALGLEVRRGDGPVMDRIAFLNHTPTERAVRAERAFLKELEGGCQVPIAAHARIEGRVLALNGMVAELDGSRIIRDGLTHPVDEPEAAGKTLARRLLSAGADGVLARIYGRME